MSILFTVLIVISAAWIVAAVWVVALCQMAGDDGSFE